MRRTTAESKRTNVHSKQLCVPFRIFFRVGNDSSFGILVVDSSHKFRAAVLLRKFCPDYPAAHCMRSKPI